MTLRALQARMTLQANAQQTARLPREDRRALARGAAQLGDLPTLWRLVCAHLVLHGRRGVKISAATLDKYQQAVEIYWRWTQDEGVDLLHPHEEAGHSYIRLLEARGLVKSSVGWHLAACRALYEALRWCAATDADPFRDVRAVADPRPQHKKGKLYTAEQIAALLLHADEEEAVVITLGADLGLRVGEIGSLRRTRVHLDAQPPTVIVDGKGGRVREVVLSRRAEAALRRWVAMTPGIREFVLSGTSVNRIENLVRRLCERAGVPYEGRAVHGLRRTAGTRAYVESQDLIGTRDFLGHTSTVTTEIYVMYARDQEKAVNRDW